LTFEPNEDEIDCGILGDLIMDVNGCKTLTKLYFFSINRFFNCYFITFFFNPFVPLSENNI